MRSLKGFVSDFNIKPKINFKRQLKLVFHIRSCLALALKYDVNLRPPCQKIEMKIQG